MPRDVVLRVSRVLGSIARRVPQECGPPVVVGAALFGALAGTVSSLQPEAARDWLAAAAAAAFLAALVWLALADIGVRRLRARHRRYDKRGPHDVVRLAAAVRSQHRGQQAVQTGLVLLAAAAGAMAFGGLSLGTAIVAALGCGAFFLVSTVLRVEPSPIAAVAAFIPEQAAHPVELGLWRRLGAAEHPTIVQSAVRRAYLSGKGAVEARECLAILQEPEGLWPDVHRLPGLAPLRNLIVRGAALVGLTLHAFAAAILALALAALPPPDLLPSLPRLLSSSSPGASGAKYHDAPPGPTLGGGTSDSSPAAPDASDGDAPDTGTGAPDASDGDAPDTGTGAPGTSDGDAPDTGTGAPGTSDGDAPDTGTGAPGTSDGDAPDTGTGAPGTSDGDAPDTGTGAPGTSDGGAPDTGTGAPGTSDGGTPDAGAGAPDTPDGGTPDAGAGAPDTPDGGAPDTGAGVPGTSDGGAPDTGTGAPGTSDGGTPDAGAGAPGTPDGGAPDAGAGAPGTPDGGAPDTGTGVPGTSDGDASDTGTGVPGTSDGDASDTGTAAPGTSDDGASDTGAAVQDTSDDGGEGHSPIGDGRGKSADPESDDFRPNAHIVVGSVNGTGSGRVTDDVEVKRFEHPFTSRRAAPETFVVTPPQPAPLPDGQIKPPERHQTLPAWIRELVPDAEGADANDFSPDADD